MTGFGSSSTDVFTVEIRSLNHRYMDIFIKMPSYLNHAEMKIRNIIKERFCRGRFDVTISINPEKTSQFTISKTAAENIYKALQSLQRELMIPGEIGIETLAAYKEILLEKEPEYNIDELLSTVREAIKNLEEMRIEEGKNLHKELLRRIEVLRDFNDKIKIKAPDEVPKLKEKFTERFKNFLETENIESNRILQEAAIMADRLDISEEISRIQSHIKQFKEVIDSGVVVGKKLDFILQELGREANTLSCKSADYEISSMVIEMKTEIEKIREQVQNIQ